jgi:DNA polymerase
MGIYDFYRCEGSLVAPPAAEENSEEMARKRESSMVGLIPSDKRLTSESAGVTVLEEVAKPRNVVAELCAISDDIGECTRCRLSKGRKNIVFGTGNEHADLMFVGEGPGADEDEQGLPFVGRAGQLLNNMIAAMGLRREDVYIANVVKCRPPGNRTPERDECETCIPFLMRQIAAIRPKVIVALGATAAKNLLAINSPMGELRGRWYDFRVNLDSQGRTDPNGPTVKLAVTYHPAFLLRDPRQKKETWKDLQMVMKYLGLKPKTST